MNKREVIEFRVLVLGFFLTPSIGYPSLGLVPMKEVPESYRRTFVKGAAATGVAASGLGVFGSASAQQNIKNLNVQISGGGLVNISNISALQNVNVSEVDVTVIGGDVDVDVQNIANNLDLTVSDVQVVNVQNSKLLNDNVVQVAVGVLSGQDLVAAGSDAANL